MHGKIKKIGQNSFFRIFSSLPIKVFFIIISERTAERNASDCRIVTKKTYIQLGEENHENSRDPD